MNRELEGVHCSRLYSGFGSSSASSADVQSALLGREPHYSPSRDFDTLHISLDLKIDFRARRVDAICRTRVRAFHDGVGSLHFDAAELKIGGAFWLGKKIAFTHKDSKLELRLPRRLKAGEETEVEVRYRIERPKTGLRFVPSYPERSPAKQVWSQGQPEDSKFWFPCHDSPHQKCTSEIRATVPAGFVAISNGRLAQTRTERGWSSYHWRMTKPHSIYLITLAAARFGVVKQRWRSVPVEFYCEKGREADAARGLAKTVKAMEFFSSKLGVDYPYEKYAQVMVGEFPGGMENTTATTMTEACLIDKEAAIDNDVDLLMAHELAHQWFGDLVTCRDWSHAWLNEGFATYFECLFHLHDVGQDELDYELYRNQQDYYQEERDRYRRPIVSRQFKNPWVLFDRHLYQKGGAVLHMLRRELGDAEFWGSIGHYLKKHAWQSVETDDLIRSIEDTTGRNLRPFFDQWVFRSGFPSLKARVQWKQREKKLELHLLQTQPISDASPAFKLALEIRVDGRDWTRHFTKHVEGKEHRWEFDLPGEPLNIELDPEHWLLAKIELHKPVAMWEHQLARAPRALSRIYAANALARWPSERSARALEAALRREKFWGAASEIALSLGGLRTPAAYKALLGFQRHKHPKTRRAIVQSIGRFKRADAKPLLTAALRRDPSLHVRAEAARQLGALADPSLAATLKAGISRRCYWDIVPGAAIQGLSSLHDPRLIPLFKRLSQPSTSYPARVYAMRALSDLSEISREVVPYLCGFLHETDDRVSLSIAGTLGRLEDERAIPPLEKAQRESKSCRVQTAAAEAVARIRAGADTPSGNNKKASR